MIERDQTRTASRAITLFTDRFRWLIAKQSEPAQLALHLLVLRVGLADHAQLTFAADNLAGDTHLLYACFNLHTSPSP